MGSLLCKLGMHSPVLVGPSDVGVEPRFAVYCRRCLQVRQATKPYWAESQLAAPFDETFISLPSPQAD